MTVPDLSPKALQLFLHAHVLHAGRMEMPANQRSAEKAERRRLIKLARVTMEDFDLAWDGKAKGGMLRAKLWGAVGIVAGDLGILLDDKGGQTLGGGQSPPGGQSHGEPI
jgi:hypothetical protein